MTSTESVKMIVRPRFVSVALHAFAILIYGLIFNVTSVGAAHSHALHFFEATQVQTLQESSVELGETTVEDVLASAESECEVKCCSRAHCASGLIAGSGTSLVVGCGAGSFVSPPAKCAAPFDQGTLKRPPKS